MPRSPAIEAGRRRLTKEFSKEELELEVKKYDNAREPVTAWPDTRGYIRLGESRLTGLQRMIEANEGMELEEVLLKYGTIELAKKYGLHKSTISRWKERLGWLVGESGRLEPKEDNSARMVG